MLKEKEIIFNNGYLKSLFNLNDKVLNEFGTPKLKITRRTKVSGEFKNIGLNDELVDIDYILNDKKEHFFKNKEKYKYIYLFLYSYVGIGTSKSVHDNLESVFPNFIKSFFCFFKTSKNEVILLNKKEAEEEIRKKLVMWLVSKNDGSADLSSTRWGKRRTPVTITNDYLEKINYFNIEKIKKFKDIKGIYSTVSSYLLSLITVINMKDYFDIVNEIFKDEMLNKNTLYIVNSNINLKRRIETNKSKNYLNEKEYNFLLETVAELPRI